MGRRAGKNGAMSRAWRDWWDKTNFKTSLAGRPRKRGRARVSCNWKNCRSQQKPPPNTLQTATRRALTLQARRLGTSPPELSEPPRGLSAGHTRLDRIQMIHCTRVRLQRTLEAANRRPRALIFSRLRRAAGQCGVRTSRAGPTLRGCDRRMRRRSRVAWRSPRVSCLRRRAYGPRRPSRVRSACVPYTCLGS